MDRRFRDKLWAEHVLQKKSVSRIVGEALAARYRVDDDVQADDGWRPRGSRRPGSRRSQD